MHAFGSGDKEVAIRSWDHLVPGKQRESPLPKHQGGRPRGLLLRPHLPITATPDPRVLFLRRYFQRWWVPSLGVTPADPGGALRVVWLILQLLCRHYATHTSPLLHRKLPEQGGV